VSPYELSSSSTGLANIQVTNNGVQSNVVQMYVTDAAPGLFSQGQSGIGIAAAEHAATGALITASSPAVAGEYISLYLTGLGPVYPTVSDGVLGPSSPLSIADVSNAGSLSVYFDDFNSGSFGNQGTVNFAGLAPGLAGLYQINVQVPSTGLTSGDEINLEIVTDAADVDQVYVPYGSGSVRLTTAAHPRTKAFLQRRAQKSKSATHRIKRAG
jgi:uncharacterized protein (TIGR03437 family)